MINIFSYCKNNNNDKFRIFNDNMSMEISKKEIKRVLESNNNGYILFYEKKIRKSF